VLMSTNILGCSSYERTTYFLEMSLRKLISRLSTTFQIFKELTADSLICSSSKKARSDRLRKDIHL